jgi:hypothetical protein
MKSLVAALSIFTMLAMAVPAADARPARARETSSAGSRDDVREPGGFAQAIQRLLQRLFGGGITANGLPTVPIPPSGK